MLKPVKELNQGKCSVLIKGKDRGSLQTDTHEVLWIGFNELIETFIENLAHVGTSELFIKELDQVKGSVLIKQA